MDPETRGTNIMSSLIMDKQACLPSHPIIFKTQILEFILLVIFTGKIILSLMDVLSPKPIKTHY